jgi:hypothetical protein
MNFMNKRSSERARRELESCSGGVLQQRGACGLAGNASEGSEWRTCTDGVGREGREVR